MPTMRTGLPALALTLLFLARALTLALPATARAAARSGGVEARRAPVETDDDVESCALAARAARAAATQASAAATAALAALATLQEGAPAELSPPVATSGVYDVLSYGADSSGHSDSTAAIQAAVHAAMDNASNHAQSEVLFPSGTYKISRTVNITALNHTQSSGVTLRGIGVAVIQMENDKCEDCDIFYGDGLWRFEISHLWMQNGKDHLNIGNHNINQGFFLIHDCSFWNASGVAINTMNANQTGAAGGSASTQLVVRDCKFNECNQVLINNCDWSTMEQCWIEASCGTGARGVIENHDTLFLRDILGVPCNKKGSAATPHIPSETYWIGNYGFTHAHNFRFGGEMGGFLPVANFAPFMCHEIFGPKAADGFQYEYCGLVNKSGGALPTKMRSSPKSSIILEGCLFAGSWGHAYGAEVYLVEIPAQLVIRDSWMDAERDNASNVVVKVDSAIDLDGPYLNNTFAATMRLDISSNNWGLQPRQTALPEQLRPHQVGQRVEGDSAPVSGLWAAGSTVWNAAVATQGNLSEGQPVGWYCTQSGTPGIWKPISLIEAAALKTDDIDHTGSADAIMATCVDLTDCTDDLQRSILLAHYPVGPGALLVPLLPGGKPWTVRPIILNVSDIRITFARGVEILAKRDQFHGIHDCLFAASMVRNLTLVGYGATWRMRKADYQNKSEGGAQPYTKAEWRHGLQLHDTEDVVVAGLTVTQTGGDGIDMGGVISGNTNTHIVDCQLLDNHRQGMSIGSAKNLLVERTLFANTSGTAPEAGVDLEPDTASESLVNVSFVDCVSQLNAGNQFSLWLANLNGSSEPVSISFTNCTVEGSALVGQAGFSVAGAHKGLRGSVRVVDSRVRGTRMPGAYLADLTSPDSFTVRFVNTSFDNVARIPVWQAAHTLSILMGSNSAFRDAKAIGGVDFVNCSVVDDCARPFMLIDSKIPAVNISYSGVVHVASSAYCRPAMMAASSPSISVHPTCVATTAPDKACSLKTDDSVGGREWLSGSHETAGWQTRRALLNL